MKLEDFKNKKKPKSTSALDKFRKEIIELVNDNYSQMSICEFLEKNGVKTSQPNLCMYIKNLSKSTTIKVLKVEEKTKEPIKKEVVKTTQKERLEKQKEDDNFFNVDIKKKYGPDTEIKHIEI